MVEVLKAMETRSSTRGYTAEKLTDEELDILLKAGLQAPTAANRQEIHITVVDGENPILAEIEREMLAGRDVKPSNSFYYGAPVLLVLSGDKNFPWSPVDAGIAVENIALAAEGLGLGSVIIGCIKGAMTGEKRNNFESALKFPEGYEYQVAIAVGHKATGKEPHTYSMENSVTRI